MATTVYTNNQYYADIAAAIRNKNGSNTQYKPSDMAGAINALIISGSAPNLQSKTVTPTTAQQVIKYDSGYNGLSQVTINAISPVKVANDITVSGATVSIPAGYYSSNVSKSVATGSAGTPTASKGTVSNNTITITPSVTNTTGYITGGTKTGTAVTVSASELVSGTLSITSNGTKNVANYASVNVNIPTGSSVTINNQDKTVTPSTSQQTISADSGYTGLGTVTVNAIQTEAKSVTPSTSQQTVSPSTGKYLTSVTVGAISTETKTITPSTATQDVTPTSGKYLSKVSVKPIPSNYIIPSGNKSITANGTGIDVTAYATVSVSVPTESTINNQSSKEATPSGSQQIITPDTGYTGLDQVIVKPIPSSYIIPSGNKSITSNGSNIDVKEYATVSVAVPATTPNLQKKTGINPTTASQTITADSNYDGLESVQINAMPTMTLPTSASSTRSGTTKATIGRSTSAQYINIPVGYNSTAASYTISAVANGSATTPTSISGTSATVSTGTNTLTLTKTVSVTPSVTAGYISSGTAGNSSVSLTASVTTKAAATITPGTSNQTIASGTYLTGTQTIVGDADLKGSNIISTASIFGVQGTVVINKYYTGDSAPSSSLGVNGDIYIQQ